MDLIRLDFDLELGVDPGLFGPPVDARLCGLGGYGRRLSGTEGAGLGARAGATREREGPDKQQWNDEARIHVPMTSASKAMGASGRPQMHFDWQLINRVSKSQHEA